MTRFKKSFDAFLAEEKGALLLAESLITLPMLIWGLMALMAYWDVFRTINETQKATYSIADLLSRQEVVTEDFVDGLQDVMSFLTPNSAPARMRVTSIEFDEGTTINTNSWDGDDRYILLFSRTSGTPAPARHTTATIQPLNSNIPLLDDLESVIIVETWVDYTPRFDTGLLNFAPGLGNYTFTQFIVTKPRKRRVCLDTEPTCV